MKHLFLLAAVGLLFSAASSQAALGWSLAECREHYKSKGTSDGIDDLGLDAYSFSTQGYTISVALEKDKVISVTYATLNFDTGVIDQILAVNAPKATWTKMDSEWLTDHSKPVYWKGSEMAINTYFAVLSQVTFLGTFVQKLQVSREEISDLIEEHRKATDL
jgi:hypothetical protein